MYGRRPVATRTTSASSVCAIAAGDGLEGDGGAALRLVDGGDFRGQQELEALLFENALKLLGDFKVHSRQDPVEILDDGHLRAQTLPHRSKLQPDHAGADHDEPGGNLLQRDAARGCDDRLLVEIDLHARRRRRFGARGDDDVARLQRCDGAVIGDHVHLAGALDHAAAVERLDLVLLEQEADAVHVRRDGVVLVFHHRGHVELRLADDDAERGQLVGGLREHLGCVQQRLRRYAADVEARAAVRLALLDDGHFQSQLRGADRAHVTTGPRSDDNQIIRHDGRFHCAVIARSVAVSVRRGPRCAGGEHCGSPRQA